VLLGVADPGELSCGKFVLFGCKFDIVSLSGSCIFGGVLWAGGGDSAR